jgi:hypothetical protein
VQRVGGLRKALRDKIISAEDENPEIVPGNRDNLPKMDTGNTVQRLLSRDSEKSRVQR